MSGREPPPEIRRARAEDAAILGTLFADYCRFYGQEHRKEAARSFIADRLRAGDSVILVAELGGAPAGFVQLYPKWSSTTMRRDWILNDLYVDPACRRRGAARALLRAAADFARQAGAAKLALKTQRGNGPARALYAADGWQEDEVFVTYTLDVDGGKGMA